MSTPSPNRLSRRLSIEKPSGASLAAIIDEPAEAAIARVVFAHCFTCGKDLKMIVRLSRMLASAGIVVLRFDMTGIGDSDGDFSQTNFLTQMDDLRSVIEYFDAQWSEPLFLIGHSFGGATSLAVTQDSESVRGTITIAAPSDTWHLARTLEGMNPDIESAGQGEVTIGGRSFLIDRQMLRQFREYDLDARIRAIQKPILAMHSPDDETVAFWHASRIVGPTSGDDSRHALPRSLIALPGSDHLFLKDPRDLEFASKVIVAWIERLAGE
ncbi:MAG: alpha/beta fold hydrolase [Pirellulaceae bacterium]